jgi:hypothetical protein
MFTANHLEYETRVFKSYLKKAERKMFKTHFF